MSVLLLAAATLLAQNPPGDRPQRPRRDPPPATVELKNFMFQEATFASAAVGKDMQYGVYLPKGYDEAANKDTKWPLVIWLHGMFEDHMRFHGRGGAPVLDKAVTDSLLPPCVFVLADGGRTSMYINAGDKKNYQDLVQKDLLEHVTKTYRVSSERGLRALMGISLGGMASLRIGFTHPELFGTIAGHSSAVFPADPKQLSPRVLQNASRFGLDEVFGSPIDEKLWRATNPMGLAEVLDPQTLDGLRLYFDAGTADDRGFGPPNKLLHEVLEKQKVPHTWQYVQGGGHAWGSGFKDESLLASLKFVGDGFRAATAGSKGGTAKGSDAGKGAPAKKDDGGGR
ncbi:MAG: alpha/beta hydrolase-fold protein [Planctomycetota bacterium]|nr:alpha/beta hydrolase-fold protein [Planctomycetota bacterium]